MMRNTLSIRVVHRGDPGANIDIAQLLQMLGDAYKHRHWRAKTVPRGAGHPGRGPSSVARNGRGWRQPFVPAHGDYARARTAAASLDRSSPPKKAPARDALRLAALSSLSNAGVCTHHQAFGGAEQCLCSRLDLPGGPPGC